MNRIAQPLAEVRMRGLVARTGTERTQGRRGGGVSERERGCQIARAGLPQYCHRSAFLIKTLRHVYSFSSTLLVWLVTSTRVYRRLFCDEIAEDR